MRGLLGLGVLVGIGVAVGCSESSASSKAPSGPAITTVSFEIDYASGAAPYVKEGPAAIDPFEVSIVNLGRLFQGKTLVLPRTLAEMEELTDVPPGPYHIDDILELANLHRESRSDGETASYYVVWVDGYYFDDNLGEANERVLGVSIGGTSVMAMFKPVLRSTESALIKSRAPYIEQTTFIHELGHAAGLVNNGYALQKQHQDSEHGAHCSNPACVMFWQNEGVESLSQFISIIVDRDIPILFDQDCLDDVDAANN